MQNASHRGRELVLKLLRGKKQFFHSPSSVRIKIEPFIILYKKTGVSRFVLDDGKAWLAIVKLKPLSFFISLLLMLKEAFDNVRIEK